LKTEAVQSAWLDALHYSDQIMEMTVPPTKYDGINDSIETLYFDLNESIELEEAGQYDAALSISTSCLSIVPCISGFVPLTISLNGLVTSIVVVDRSK